MTDRNAVLPAAAWNDHVYAEVAAKVVAWNTDSFGDNPPQGWVDMWNMEKFPGRRSLWKQAFQTLEVALMGDGVPKDQIYPIDVAKRGLAALDKIKPELIWWESGGQSAQFLIDGESDVGSTWNGRVYGPKVDGAPVDYTFNDALFVSGAWCVVKGAKQCRLVDGVHRPHAGTRTPGDLFGKHPLRPGGADGARVSFPPTACRCCRVRRRTS